MSKVPLDAATGITAEFRKTVSESDVYLLAGMLGDFDPLHVDEEYCKKTQYGTRIAQGALIVGFMMAAAARAAEKIDAILPSLGFDRVRHIKAVKIGDTVEVIYQVTEIDSVSRRGKADIRVLNQHGELVGVALHIFKSVD